MPTVCWLRASWKPPQSLASLLGVEGEVSLCQRMGRQEAWVLQTPSCAPQGLGCQLTPPPTTAHRSWLHLSVAHLPPDCLFVIFPAPAPHSGLLSDPGPCLLPEAAPQVSSVSLKLCPSSFCSRLLPGPGVTHPSRHSLPTLHSVPGSACLPRPPPATAPAEIPLLRCLFLTLALKRSQKLQPQAS